MLEMTSGGNNFMADLRQFNSFVKRHVKLTYYRSNFSFNKTLDNNHTLL